MVLVPVLVTEVYPTLPRLVHQVRVQRFWCIEGPTASNLGSHYSRLEDVGVTVRSSAVAGCARRKTSKGRILGDLCALGTLLRFIGPCD